MYIVLCSQSGPVNLQMGLVLICTMHISGNITESFIQLFMQCCLVVVGRQLPSDTRYNYDSLIRSLWNRVYLCKCANRVFYPILSPQKQSGYTRLQCMK